MSLTTIQNQPVEIRKLLPKTRQAGEQKEFTAGFECEFDYSTHILEMLSMDGEAISLEGLWDEEGKPNTSIDSVKFTREFGGLLLSFKRNNKSVLAFQTESVKGFTAKPTGGGNLKVKFNAFGICAEGDTNRIHKMLKDPGITLTIEEGHGVQGTL
jgi:hypothetical protein